MRRMCEQAMGATLTSLYAYIFCMMASQALTGMPLYGGALFMCGRVAAVFAQTYRVSQQPYLPAAAKRARWVLLVLFLLLDVLLLVLYPLSLRSPQIWLLMTLVLTMLLRDSMCMRLTHLHLADRLTERRYLAYALFWHALAFVLTVVILLCNLPAGLALPMLAVYFLCALVSFYDMLRQRDSLQQSAEPAKARGARRANAYRVYEHLSTLIPVAMEMTLIVMYTYLAATTEQMLIRMPMAVLTTLACREGAERFLAWRRRRGQGDPTNLLLVGMGMWLWGLWRFIRMLEGASASVGVTYASLALCSVGCALCSASLAGMELPMQAVARFAGGDAAEHLHLKAAGRELATLLGQMLALAALTALCFLYGEGLPRTVEELAARFRPVMAVPAMITAVMAFLCVFRFPLTSRYLGKVMRFLRIREAGGDNPALEKQLESVVMQRHTQPFLIRALMAVLRPCFRHTLKDADRVRPDESNPIVFLCNHGEVYGPVAGMLFCPVPVRSWSISDMMIDPKEVAEYSYKYTFSQIRWLGPLRWPVARLLGHVSVWGMRKLEAVPVFRNKPRELMDTFRRSVEAMQAGDNLLIFPENPDADPNAPGYESGRPGELFRGFPMLAQVYHSKTGKRCRFMPMLAHKGMRTLSFGTEIVYDPDAAPIDERDRIVAEASRQLQALYEREEALFRQGREV